MTRQITVEELVEALEGDCAEWRGASLDSYHLFLRVLGTAQLLADAVVAEQNLVRGDAPLS